MKIFTGRSKILAAILSVPLLGATWYVRPDGHDTSCTGAADTAYPGSGSGLACAFKTIQKCHDTMTAAGDVCNIGSGTYYQSVTASKSGAAGNPLLFQRTPGHTAAAILDSGPSDPNNNGSLPNNDDWTLIDAGKGIWESNFTLPGGSNHAYGYVTGIRDHENGDMGLVPYADTRNASGKVCVGGDRPWKSCKTSTDCAAGGGSCVTYFGARGYAFLEATGTTYGDPNVPFYVGPGLHMPKTCVDGPNDGQLCDTKSGTGNANIDCGTPGVCTRSGKVRIRLAKTPELREYEARWNPVFPSENQDPRAYGIFVSNATNTLKITGSYQTWKNLVFHPALRTIQFDGNAPTVQTGFVFDGVTVYVGDKGIASGNSSGDAVVDGITVTAATITGNDNWWIFWSDEKNVPFPADKMRSTHIDIRRGGKNLTVTNSLLRAGHDGIGFNNCETGLIAHHNRIENFSDDAFELEGAAVAECATAGVGNVDIYQNYIAGTLTSYAIGQATETMLDGTFGNFDHNVVVLLRDHPVNRDANINSWNGHYRYGHEYAYKSHTFTRQPLAPALRLRYCYNTVVLGTSGSNGIHVVPKTAWGLLTADVYTRNNLFVKVNGVVQGTLTVPADQPLDRDLYWKMNADGATLIHGYSTTAALCAAKGWECNGLGAISNYGTDPLFATFDPLFDKSDSTRWTAEVGSMYHSMADLALSAASPARGVAVLGDCPSRGLPTTDLGAIAYGTDPATFNVFPFNQEWGGPYFGERGRKINGGRAVGVKLQ